MPVAADPQCAHLVGTCARQMAVPTGMVPLDSAAHSSRAKATAAGRTAPTSRSGICLAAKTSRATTRLVLHGWGMLVPAPIGQTGRARLAMHRETTARTRGRRRTRPTGHTKTQQTSRPVAATPPSLAKMRSRSSMENGRPATSAGGRTAPAPARSRVHAGASGVGADGCTTCGRTGISESVSLVSGARCKTVIASPPWRPCLASGSSPRA
mmetsp:Transcript_120474/g.336114  ORF Transcript_120474/g.336114 Transcript_120474/m.336114 type:complete len:211 (-) Transcript_120474:1721-2353(-)